MYKYNYFTLSIIMQPPHLLFPYRGILVNEGLDCFSYTLMTGLLDIRLIIM